MDIDYLRARWDALKPRTRQAVYAALAVVILLSLLSTCARAVEPGWYGPQDGSGQGIFIRCSEGGRCASTWLTYGGGEQIWLISTNTCERGAAQCDLEFARTEGQWFGDEFSFSDTLVFADIETTADSIIVDFNAMLLFPNICFDITPGGLLFRNCVGVDEFFLLAR